MAKIYCEKKRKYTYFVLKFEYEKAFVDKVKEIPSAEYHGKKKVWYVRITPISAPIIIDLNEKWGFKCSNRAINKAKDTVKGKEGLLKLSSAVDADIDAPEFPGDLELFPFQRAGAKYMVDSKRCFNGDDMGLGKTVQDLAAMEMADAYPHIVVCPATMKKSWRREAEKWLPHRSSAILNDDNFSYHYDIMILNYEVVNKFLMREIPKVEGRNRYKIRENIKMQGIEGLTLDESHYCKNRTSKRTKAIRKLSKLPEYVWLLSGTIIENRPEEFITQLQILNRLTDLGGYQNFVRTYCDAEQGFNGHWETDGASNLEQLNKRLRETCMIRRLKGEVGEQLPDKLKPKVYRVGINTQGKYDIAKDNIWEYLAMERKEERGNTLGLYEDNAEKQREVVEESIELQIINSLRKITALGKIPKAKAWIKNFLEHKDKLIVFCHHKEVQRALIRAFPGCCKITGGMTSAEKDRNEYRFQNTDCPLIVCSIKAAGIGLDLFESHSVLHVELAWTPSAHDQAEDRAWRIGQTEDVQPYWLLGKDTIDEDIFDLLQKKRKVVGASLDGFMQSETADIKKELIEVMKDKGQIKIPETDEK